MSILHFLNSCFAKSQVQMNPDIFLHTHAQMQVEKVTQKDKYNYHFMINLNWVHNNNNNVFSLLKLLSKFSTKLISNFLPSLQTPNSHHFLLFAEEKLSNKKSCNFWLLSSLYTLLTPSNLASAFIKEVFKITNEILCQFTFNLIFQKDLTKLINWIFEAFSSPAW